MTLKEKFWTFFGSLLLISILGLLIYRYAFYGYVENYELGYQFDTSTGITKPILNQDGSPRCGYVYANPLVFVYTIDTRPMQVTINANNRVLNAKLVQFDPKGLKTFLAWHGNGNYNQDALREILKSYAYDASGKDYDFLKINDVTTSHNDKDIKDTVQSNKVQTVLDTISK